MKKTIESSFVMRSEKLEGLRKERFTTYEAQILKEELGKIKMKFNGKKINQQ